MVETDEFVSSNSEGFLMDSFTSSSAYLKMKKLCVDLSNEIQTDIKIHNEHVLPRYTYSCVSGFIKTLQITLKTYWWQTELATYIFELFSYTEYDWESNIHAIVFMNSFLTPFCFSSSLVQLTFQASQLQFIALSCVKGLQFFLLHGLPLVQSPM